MLAPANCCCRYTTWSCHAFIPLHLLFITNGADVHAADTHVHAHDDGDDGAEERLSAGANYFDKERVSSGRTRIRSRNLLTVALGNLHSLSASALLFIL